MKLSERDRLAFYTNIKVSLLSCWLASRPFGFCKAIENLSNGELKMTDLPELYKHWPQKEIQYCGGMYWADPWDYEYRLKIINSVISEIRLKIFWHKIWRTIWPWRRASK